METPEQRIVVGIDGSRGARLALGWAMAEAARRRAALEVVSAFPVDFAWADPYLLDPRRIDSLRSDTGERAWALVHEVRSGLSDPGAADVPVDVVVVAGAAAAHLVHRAEGADLLVVGSRGRGGVRSAVAGSVALHCTAHAACPVVVVHAGSVPFDEPARVVVGLDDSEHGRQALAAAVTEAGLLGARVEAVLAYEAPNYWSDLYALMLPPAGETADQARERGQALVREVVGGEVAERVTVVATEGHPAQVVMRQAEGARLLVLGSRGRNQLEAVALGSVALSAVMHAPCPVLVVRPPRTARAAPRRAVEAVGAVGAVGAVEAVDASAAG